MTMLERALGGEVGDEDAEALLREADHLLAVRSEELRRHAAATADAVAAEKLHTLADEMLARRVALGAPVAGAAGPTGSTRSALHALGDELGVIAVTAAAGDANASITFSPVAGASAYTVTLAELGTTATVAAQRQSALPPETWKATGLTNGRTYVVTVQAFLTSGGVPVAQGKTVAMPIAAGMTPKLALDLDDHLISPLSPRVPDLSETLAQAARTGATWRYDFLRELAATAAGRAAEIDARIDTLMSLDVTKLTQAEQLIGPAFSVAQGELSKLAAKVRDAPVPDVEDVAREVARSATSLVLLQRLLTWLASSSMVGFWVGLFGAVIDDLAAFAVQLPRTHDYLREAFASQDIGAAVLAIVDASAADAGRIVDELAVPVRLAVGAVVGRLTAASQAVFAAFDEPLLVQRGGDVAGDPLAGATGELSAAVEDIVGKVRGEVMAALRGAARPEQAALLFEVIMVTYIVLPMLAALVVALAGGPVSAALLAAAVTLGGQELVRLVARLLTGPLTSQLDEARAHVDAALAKVKDVLAEAFPATLKAPSANAALNLAAGQLGAVSDLLPKAFLDDAARTLADARDAILREASSLALAAEQSLGLETANVYDVVEPPRPAAARLLAPQLPAGDRAGRFSSESLLRQLARLDGERLGLADGKDVEITQRLSLHELLGGRGDPMAATTAITDGLQRLLAGNELHVVLRSHELLDRSHPGLYRARISEIRASGVFSKSLGGLAGGMNVPLHVTHLGPSRTRVLASSLSAAVPPRRPVLSSRAFAERLIDDVVFDKLQAGRQKAEAYLLARAQELDAVGELPVTLARLADTPVLGPAAVDLSSGEGSANFTFEGLRELWRFKARPVLVDGARRDHLAARARLARDAGKWAAARMEQDPSPQAAALGFVTLVREQPPETAVFNLISRDGALANAVVPGAAAATPELPLPTAASAQSRPFEDRGLEGTVALRLPSARQATEVLGQVPQPLLQGLPPGTRLADVLLDVTIRGSFSEDLAAALRFGAEGQADALDIARLAAGATAPELTLAPPLGGTGASERRTVRVSLREHRDETLRAWQSLASSLPSLTAVTGVDWSAVAAEQQLAADEPLRGLPLLRVAGEDAVAPTAGGSAPAEGAPAVPAVVSLAFAGSPAGGLSQQQAASMLAEAGRRISVRPEMLGVEPAQLTPAAEAGAVPSGLAEIAIAIVPSRAGVRQSASVGRSGVPDKLYLPALAVRHGNIELLGAAGKQVWHATRMGDRWAAPGLVGSLGNHAASAVAAAEVQDALHVVAVDAQGRLHHALKGTAGWSKFGDAGAAAGNASLRFRDVGCAEVGDHLHVVAVLDDKSGIRHTARRPDGTWQPWSTLTRPALSLAAAAVAGELHLVWVDRDATALRHSVLRGGAWTNAGDASAAAGLPPGPGGFLSCAAAEVGGQLHVVGVHFLGLTVPVIRHRSGTWSQVPDAHSRLCPTGQCAGIALAGLDGDLHAVSSKGKLAVIVVVPDGGLWHATRHPDGSWATTRALMDDLRTERRWSDPLGGVRLRATGPLQRLLPGYSAEAPLIGRIVATSLEEAEGDRPLVRASELFTAGSQPPMVALRVGEAIRDRLVHDVIVSLTFASPVPTVVATPP